MITKNTQITFAEAADLWLEAIPDWMVDNDPSTGPFEINTSGFDFGYNNSHEGQGW